MVAALRATGTKPDARAGKKEGGWGEGIFAHPSVPPERSGGGQFRSK